MYGLLFVRNRLLRVEDQADEPGIRNPDVATPFAYLMDRTPHYSQAQGVLVIENLDTFEAICRHSSAPDTWLCLWGHGYVNNSLTGLVRSIDRVTACWADLDAHGINIVGDLQRRSEHPVSPIFMDAGLHDEFAFLEQDNKQVSLAQDLAVTGHPELRALAARVAATRLGREQETMHHLIHKLDRSLLLLARQAAGGIATR